jgi:hypothetical protein
VRPCREPRPPEPAGPAAPPARARQRDAPSRRSGQLAGQPRTWHDSDRAAFRPGDRDLASRAQIHTLAVDRRQQRSASRSSGRAPTADAYVDVLRNVALVGVLGVVPSMRFPSYSLGTRDVRLADVFRILKQRLDFFLYNASVFGR